MVADHDAAVERLDRVAQIDALGRDREVGVGHDHAEQQQRVRGFDLGTECRVAGQAEVGAAHGSVGFGQQTATHETGDHRNGQPPRQLGDTRFEAVAANLHADHQHRPARAVQAL